MSTSAWGIERDAAPAENAAGPAKAARRGGGEVRVVQLSRVAAHGHPRETLLTLGFEEEFKVNRRGKRYAVPGHARGLVPAGEVEVFRLHGDDGQLYAVRGSEGAVPWIVHARFTVPEELEAKADALGDAVAAWMRALRPFVEPAPGA